MKMLWSTEGCAGKKRRKRKNDLYRRCQWERLLNGKLEKQKGLLISMRQPISSKDHFGWQWTILGITRKRKSVITGKFWRKIMEKYCVTVAGPFEEEVYRFNSSDPKKIIKKWFEQEKAHALCANIQAATREDALMLLTWAFENIEYVKKQYPGCHYRWNYICDGIEKEISEKCKNFQWEWDSVFPFCMG